MNDLVTLLPILSLLIAGASFYFARKKDTKDDTAHQTAKQTEVAVELRGMRTDISEMKSDMRDEIAELKSEIKSLRMEYKQDHDEIVGMKRDFNTMWKRIDELKTLVQDNAKKQEKETSN